MMLAYLLGMLGVGVLLRVAHVRRRARVWWELDRIRAAVAFEPDPGPWAHRGTQS